MATEAPAAWPLPPLPSPSAVRLVGPAPPNARLVPPFALKTWSDAPDAAVVVVLAHAPLSLGEVVSQLPDPETLPPSTLVLVLGDVTPSGGLLGRWLRTRVSVPRSVRTSALLSLGYTDLGGGTDPTTGQDLAWGYVSRLPSRAL